MESRPVDNKQVQTCVAASKTSVAILSIMHEQELLSDLVWVDDQFIFNTGITLWLRGFTEFGVIHRLEVEEFLPILARTYSSRLGQYAYDSLFAFYSDAEASLRESQSVSKFRFTRYLLTIISKIAERKPYRCLWARKRFERFEHSKRLWEAGTSGVWISYYAAIWRQMRTDEKRGYTNQVIRCF